MEKLLREREKKKKKKLYGQEVKFQFYIRTHTHTKVGTIHIKMERKSCKFSLIISRQTLAKRMREFENMMRD